MNNKIRAIGAALVAIVWLALTGFAWFGPTKTFSNTERASLQQFPELTEDNILSGNFMSEFNEYTLDQFPMRDLIRQLKARFHLNVMGFRDNNGKYVADGYIADMSAATDKALIAKNMAAFQRVYDRYLKEAGCNAAVAIVPDKNYYMAQDSGHLSMDYDYLFGAVQETVGSWATYVDLTEILELSDFYYTDTHWRQEKIIPVAQAVAKAFGVEGPKTEDFETVTLEQPFYGVYYGQLAMPLPGEAMHYLTNDTLENVLVSYEMKEPVKGVYATEKADHYDPYEVFLNGTQAVITIENPNARTSKELIVLRDSFGSSLTPLLVQDYAKITILDTRWLTSGTFDLGKYVEFHGQDVLFVYSTTVLNSMNLK